MHEEYENIQLDHETDSYIFKFLSRDTARIIPMHFHKEVEILYCIKGNLKIWIEGKQVVLNQGEFFFLNSLVPHATQSLSSSEVVVLYLSDEIFKKEQVQIKVPKAANASSAYQRCIDRINQIYQQSQGSERFQKYLQQSLVLELEYLFLKEFSEDIGKDNQKQFAQNAKISKVIHLVRNNFHRNISLEELSQLSGYSMHYLSRMFHKNTGLTFYEYKKSLCLELALKMIETTNESLEEIALKSGFPNEKSMREYFKKIMGISPIKYKMAKNDRK